MKQTKLSDIIEKNVDDKLYLKKKDFEKRKYLKISVYRNCTINGDIVTIEKDDIKPPQILKIKRTEEEKRRRRQFGEKGLKFGSGKFLDVTNDGYSNTLTTFSSDNYVWDRNNQVRELTNYEAFRLMDVDEADTLKLLETIPKSQCKKLAGNSICVNVLTELFREMFNRKENPEKSLF